MSLFKFLARPPTEAYPLLAAVAVGCTFGTFMSFRYITKNNDVVVDKHNASNLMLNPASAVENLKTTRLRASGALPPVESHFK